MSVILQVDGLHCHYAGTAGRGQVKTDVETWGRVSAGAGYGYRGSGNGVTNWQSNVAPQEAADWQWLDAQRDLTITQRLQEADDTSAAFYRTPRAGGMTALPVEVQQINAIQQRGVSAYGDGASPYGPMTPTESGINQYGTPYNIYDTATGPFRTDGIRDRILPVGTSLPPASATVSTGLLGNGSKESFWDGFSSRMVERVGSEVDGTPLSNPIKNGNSTAAKIGSILADSLDDYHQSLRDGRASPAQQTLAIRASAPATNNVLFRGGNSLVARLGVDVKPAADGLIHPLSKSGKPQGLSLNLDPKDPFIQKYGGAFPVSSLPGGLQALQSGKPGHFVVAPTTPMHFEKYQQLLNQIQLKNFNALQ